MRPYTKKELKRVFSNLKEKGITDGMAQSLIDETYNEEVILRTSGFFAPKAGDSVMTWTDATRTLLMEPFVPDAGGETIYDVNGNVYEPHFSFYVWEGKPVLQRRYAYNPETTELPNPDEIQIPAEEGLFAIYYDFNQTTRRYELTYAKNPEYEDIGLIYLTKAIVAWVYYDATNAEAIYFGDERHGSEWNPPMHWWAHGAFNALWKSGLQHNGVIIGDGSLNSHAQFGIDAGEFLHEDMEHAVSAVASTAGLPVMWFSGAVDSNPRIELNPGYSFLKGASFIYYNAAGAKVECTDGYFMLYHVFATNCQLYPLISVMGTNQYENKNSCCKAALEEMRELKAKLPQQTALPIASFAFEVSSLFTNNPKARIVEPCTGQGCMIWIEEYYNWYDILIQIDIEEADSDVLTEKSVTGDGTTSNKIRLVNDEENPTAKKYYGTDEAEAKGYHPLPEEAVQYLTGATPTFDLENGRGAAITLSADTTITFDNLVDNDTGHIEVKQNATGGWELHFDTVDSGVSIEIAYNSYEAAGQVKLTGMAGSKDIVVYWFSNNTLKLAVVFNLLV